MVSAGVGALGCQGPPVSGRSHDIGTTDWDASARSGTNYDASKRKSRHTDDTSCDGNYSESRLPDYCKST